MRNIFPCIIAPKLLCYILFPSLSLNQNAEIPFQRHTLGSSASKQTKGEIWLFMLRAESCPIFLTISPIELCIPILKASLANFCRFITRLDIRQVWTICLQNAKLSPLIYVSGSTIAFSILMENTVHGHTCYSDWITAIDARLNSVSQLLDNRLLCFPSTEMH